MFLVFCLILSLTAGYHDHHMHPNPSFIRGEARRVAYNTYETVIQEINKVNTFLTQISTDFWSSSNKIVSDEGKETWALQWEDDWGQYYRRNYDHFVILSHVCEDVFNATSCIVPDPWDEALDIRKRQFHDEFISEIHKEIQGDIKKIKMWKQQKSEL